MRNEEQMILDEQVEKLDMFFQCMIRRAKIRTGIEQLKEDFLQDTALAVLEKLENEVYTAYDLIKLIWVKAKDVWAEYFRRQKRSPHTLSMSDELPAIAIVDEVEANPKETDLLKIPARVVDPKDWDMLVLHYVEELPYKEIAMHYHLNEGTVKERVYRVKQKLKHYKRRY